MFLSLEGRRRDRVDAVVAKDERLQSIEHSEAGGVDRRDAVVLQMQNL